MLIRRYGDASHFGDNPRIPRSSVPVARSCPYDTGLPPHASGPSDLRRSPLPPRADVPDAVDVDCIDPFSLDPDRSRLLTAARLMRPHSTETSMPSSRKLIALALGLGIALIGIGWIYGKIMRRDAKAAGEPAVA